MTLAIAAEERTPICLMALADASAGATDGGPRMFGSAMKPAIEDATGSASQARYPDAPRAPHRQSSWST